MKSLLSIFIISCLLFAFGCSGSSGGAVATLSEIKSDAGRDLIDREDITVCRFSYDASTEEHPSENSIYEDALMQTDLPDNSVTSIRLDQEPY